jgi:hypothetical protein
MKTSTILKKAKKQLAKDHEEVNYTDKESFICYSITAVSEKSGSYDETDRVREIVQSRLEPYATLETWLAVNHKIKIADWNSGFSKRNAYIDKIQATRHAWVDSMIEEFKAKGD